MLTEQLISNWYPRHVLAKRIAAFYLGGACLGGFGNIIAVRNVPRMIPLT